MAYALATRLLRAVKNAGVKYNQASGWKSHGRGTMGTVQTVVCHHTAGPKSGNSPSLNVVRNGRPGLNGPLAQLFLARDGTVTLVGAGIANHAGVVRANSYSNSHAIGIEAENTGLSNDPWPSKQLDAYAKLCKALCNEFGLSTSRVLGHKEVCSPVGRKPDPSFSMPDFRKKVDGAKGGVSQGGGSAGGGAKTYSTVAYGKTLGKWDKGDPVKDWQDFLVGQGYKLKDGVDGYFGDDTVTATKSFQESVDFTGKDVDGMAGKDTIAKASKDGFTWKRKPKASKPEPKPAAAKVAVDGKWGTGTTKALQKLLGTPVDGEVSFQPVAFKAQNPGLLSGWEWTKRPRSSNVIEALQKKLGVTADGRIGPNTIKALQRKLGTGVDGKVSSPSAMVKQLQRNLNAGKIW